MRIEQLFYFKKLAEVGSITATSQELFISQQALSAAIKKLEEELHTQLFLRTSQGVSLTVSGEYLLQQADKILSMLDQIKLHFLNEKQEDIQLSIGSIPVALRHILPKTISYFYKNLPNVHLNISTLSTSEIIAQVQSNILDLGIISTLAIDGEDELIFDKEIAFTPIMQLSFSVVVHKNHPLNKFNRLSLSQLVQYPALIMDYGDAETALPKRILTHYNVSSMIPINNEILYNQMLEDGLGYALYTDINAYNLSPSLSCHALKDNLSSCIGYIQNTNTKPTNPFIQLFCDHLSM